MACHIRTIGRPRASHRREPNGDSRRAGGGDPGHRVLRQRQRSRSAAAACPVRGLPHAGPGCAALHRCARFRGLRPGIRAAVRHRACRPPEGCRVSGPRAACAAVALRVLGLQRPHPSRPWPSARWRHRFPLATHADLRHPWLAVAMSARRSISVDRRSCRLSSPAAERQEGTSARVCPASLVLDDRQSEVDAVGDDLLLGG